MNAPVPYVEPCPDTQRSDAGPVASCACCGRRYSDAEWQELWHVGIQDLGLPDVTSELKNCRCSSTLAREVPKHLFHPDRDQRDCQHTSEVVG